MVDFTRPALDHQDGILCPSDAQIEVRYLRFLIGRVEDECAGDAPHSKRPDRTEERDVGDRQRGRGAVDGQDVDLRLAVRGESIQDDLDIVSHVFGEQRTKRTIGQPGGQDGRFRRPALSAEEGAGDATTGVEPLFVVDRQGEEVNPLARSFGHRRRGQQQRVGLAQGDGAVGLPGNLARFDGDRLAANGGRELSYFWH